MAPPFLIVVLLLWLCLRPVQHLQDTYGEHDEYARLLQQLSEREYGDVAPELRLQALVTLVNDCLQTKTFRSVSPPAG